MVITQAISALLTINSPSTLFSLCTMSDDFYVRYYVGHKGKFGHEYLEFEFRSDGKVRVRERDQSGICACSRLTRVFHRRS